MFGYLGGRGAFEGAFEGGQGAFLGGHDGAPDGFEEHVNSLRGTMFYVCQVTPTSLESLLGK